MTQPVIKVQGLGKRYKLGLTHAGSVRELANRVFSGLTGELQAAKVTAAKESRPEAADHIWALRDINFEVHPGEVLGIIGRNGAGKSTLLKVLSRITKPTQGRVEMRGRVASLLEVGTGFHPELTGRENVYMNGTVLGMTRKEIDRQFDSIVDFSGVETFIDTPVKRYSSGMTVRLGFAVAAHMSPEILIIDEVLAVGDAEFQKRCIGKMDNVAKSGRTVLFVSHNMASIRQLAPRSILIEEGQIIFDGATENALDRYLGHSIDRSTDPTAVESLKRLDWAGDRSVEFIEAQFARTLFKMGEQKLPVRLKVRASVNAASIRIGATIYLADGSPVGSAFSLPLPTLTADDECELEMEIDSQHLAPGHYWFRLGLLNARNQVTDLVDEVLHFEIPPRQNVPGEFVRWDPGWGALCLKLELVNQNLKNHSSPVSLQQER
jgi:lipopolysaccharide transport system ATP-binding protein